MSSLTDIVKNLPDTGDFDEDKVMEMMANPAYIDASTNLIQQALERGADVLQLENGDVVTTEVKTVVTVHRFDDEKGEMEKLTARQLKEEQKKIQEQKEG